MPEPRPIHVGGRGLVVLLHDAGVTADDWRPWLGLLDEQGYDAVPALWPREGRGGGEHSLGELAGSAAEIVDAQERTPVVLGHGVGAVVAQLLADRSGPAAVIAIAPAPTGVRASWTPLPAGPAPLRVARRPLVRPGRARAAVAGRPPLLLLSGGADPVSPERAVEALRRRSRRRHPEAVSDHQVFPGRGHGLVRDEGWEDVAWFCVDWLVRQGL